MDRTVVITELEDMRKWDGAILAMRMAIRNGYPSVYKNASTALHEVADKYDETKKPMWEILLGL